MKKFLIAFIGILFLASAAFAATNTVMLVGDTTFVDSATASAAASKTGTPVLVLDNGMLNDNIRSTLQGLSPMTVVLVGGPAVIKPGVETELANSYKVIRLWGLERTGTALEVAKQFWPEGASCAVLVDDTKNNDNDFGKERSAANLATHYNCTLIPVPAGTVPSDVLSTLKDLNVSNVWFVGMLNTDAKQALGQFNLTEITGDDNKIQDAVENETEKGIKKLVVVATPDWKAAVAFSANPDSHSVIKHVSSADNLSDIINSVKEYNLTSVRVVGVPDLVKQIASKLMALNITVTQISGQKADEIAEALVRNTTSEWNDKKAGADAAKSMQSSNISQNLQDRLNKTENELDALSSEAQSLAPGTDTTALLNAINASKAELGTVNALIQAGNFDKARDTIADALSKVKELRFEKRTSLNINITDDAKSEEESINSAASRIDDNLNRIAGMLPQALAKCNSTTLSDFLNRTKALRAEMQDARQKGDFKNASDLNDQAKQLSDIGLHIGELCRTTGKGIDNEDSIAARNGFLITRLEHMQNENRTNETRTAANQTGAKTYNVEITADGFSPKTLEIHAGDTVVFTNKDSQPHHPASNPHPTHTDLPGFDALKSLATGETYTYTFTKVGTWGYHDHLNPSTMGSVKVD